MATKKSEARPPRISSAAKPQDEILEAAKAAIASKGDNVHLRDVMRVLHALVTSKEQGLPKNRRLALNRAYEVLGKLSSGRLTPDALFEYGAIESLGELMRRKGWLREPDPEAVPIRGVEDWKLTDTERQNRSTEEEICRLHELGATGQVLQELAQYPDVLEATGLANVWILPTQPGRPEGGRTMSDRKDDVGRPGDAKLVQASPQSQAKGFYILAEAITSHLNRLASQPDSRELGRLYMIYRQSVGSWRRLTHKYLPNAPALSELPTLIGNDWYAGLTRLAECCEDCAARLRGKPKAQARKRRRRPSETPPKVTGKQAEVVQVVGECKGNFSEAARRLALDRKTVKQHYNAAMRKTGAVVRKVLTGRLPTDNRGQVSLTEDRRRG